MIVHVKVTSGLSFGVPVIVDVVCCNTFVPSSLSILSSSVSSTIVSPLFVTKVPLSLFLDIVSVATSLWIPPSVTLDTEASSTTAVAKLTLLLPTIFAWVIVWPFNFSMSPSVGDTKVTFNICCVLKLPSDTRNMSTVGKYSSGVSLSNALKNISCAFFVPLRLYKDKIFLVSCLLSKPLVSVFGIVCKKVFLNCRKKSSNVSLTSAYSSNCVSVSFGFALYLPITPWAPDVPPVIVSPVTNFELAVIKIFRSSVSSASIVAVSPEVPPVIVSPFWNSPIVSSSLSM